MDCKKSHKWYTKLYLYRHWRCYVQRIKHERKSNWLQNGTDRDCRFPFGILVTFLRVRLLRSFYHDRSHAVIIELQMRCCTEIQGRWWRLENSWSSGWKYPYQLLFIIIMGWEILTVGYAMVSLSAYGGLHDASFVGWNYPRQSQTERKHYFRMIYRSRRWLLIVAYPFIFRFPNDWICIDRNRNCTNLHRILSTCGQAGKKGKRRTWQISIEKGNGTCKTSGKPVRKRRRGEKRRQY